MPTHTYNSSNVNFCENNHGTLYQNINCQLCRADLKILEKKIDLALRVMAINKQCENESFIPSNQLKLPLNYLAIIWQFFWH